jgi:L-tartrate/succinate antiporter
MVWLALVLVPHPTGLSANAWNYLALFVAVIVTLILEPIPPAAAGLIGVTASVVFCLTAPKPSDAIKWGLSGFSDGTVWLIFGALVFARGYERTGLGRRIAVSLVNVLGKRTLGLGYAVMLADLLIAPFTPSNTGRSAGVIYPIIRGIPALYGSAPGPTARRLGGYLMWTAFASTAVTSSMFLTALSPNLLAVSLVRQATAVEISWSQWASGFLPVGIVLIAPLPLLVYVIYPPEIRSSQDVAIWAKQELAQMGRFSTKETLMVLFVLSAFALWVLGGEWINPTTVILAVVSLMVLARVIDWDDVVGNRSAWDTVVYFATLLTLADGLNRLGIVNWAAQGVSSRLTGASPLVAMIALVTFFFLVHYLFASLTAHTVAVLPAILAAGIAIPGMPVHALALLLCYSIGLMGVITPYATGPAPVYFGSGFVPRRDFWALGFIFGVIFLATLLVVGIPFVFGFTR